MSDYLVQTPDEPCTHSDLLPERVTLAKQMARTIALNDTPLVVGVNGDWGSGKTSFLHRLRYELTGTPAPPAQNGKQKKAGQSSGFPHVVPIWFEAWRYQHEQAPVVALLHEIRSQLSLGHQFLLEAAKLSEVGVRGALLSIEGLTKQIGFRASKIQEAGEAWERDHLAEKLPSAQLREFLDAELGKLLGKTGDKKGKKGEDRRLVVFIDDLDRCEPETAFRLLESIKVYLNLRRCVFVIGLNQREVERALARVIPSGNRKEPSELAIRAHEYLEKICANVWHLPQIPLEKQVALIESWLEDKINPEFLQKVCVLLKDHSFLPSNARRLKTFSNALLRLCHARTDAENNPRLTPNDAALACIITVLQQFHPRLWRHVDSEPEFLFEIQNHARDSTAKQPTPSNAIPKTGDLHPELALLHLPSEGTVDAQTGNVAFTSRFADLAYGNALHCQRLIAKSAFTLEDIKRVLSF